MFTGIVEELGKVVSINVPVFTIEGNVTLKGAKLGDSIAMNGVCLTLTSLKGRQFTVDVTPETQRRSNLDFLKPGRVVNLERPLAYGGRLGGHLVEGHVDGVGKLLSIKPERESNIVTFQAPSSISRYIVEKGFIAIDGISLTIVSENANRFSVAVIPYTYRHTTLGAYKPGAPVNLEVDILAKYVERLAQRSAPRTSRKASAKHKAAR
ncbi:MAG: riboflavin synthase [Dehalococcoidia bacterium]|nr:riboflavin synthase [Dehalococcoidia bacterium]